MPAEELNPKQMLFLDAYIKDPSPSRAAKAAGYSDASAHETGNRILNLPVTKRLLKEINDRAAAELGITSLKVIKELAVIAFATPGDVIHEDAEGDMEIKARKLHGTEVNITSTSGKNKTKITSIKTIKNADKIQALALLAKHMGLLKDKVEVEHSGSLLDLIEASFKEPDSV